MTDTPNKIEEIRAALEGYEKTEVYGPLIPLAPDMARIVLAAEDLAYWVDRRRHCPGERIDFYSEMIALAQAAYRKAVEGGE